MLVFIDNLFPWFGDMLELGGDILLVIILMALLIYTLVFERLGYLYWVYPHQRDRALVLWRGRDNRDEWHSRHLRALLVARLRRGLRHNSGLTRTLIKLCPLLGLLGTVLGMLEVFDGVAAAGFNSPRSTASGVSKAMVTTIAGMVVAIAGILVTSLVNRRLEAESGKLNEVWTLRAWPERTESPPLLRTESLYTRILEELTDRHYGYRLLAVAAAGAASALALTWFMHGLIHSGHQRLDETTRAHLLDFVRIKREERSVSKNLRPARPTLSEAPPAPAVPEADPSRADTTLNIPELIVPDTIGDELSIGGPGFNFSEGDYLPIVKVAPVYPPQAHYRGIEGECVVVYTVTATGSTRDVRVVEDMCTHRIFRKSSIDAAKKFKYKPRIIDGEAVEVHGVLNSFTYDIQGIDD